MPQLGLDWIAESTLLDYRIRSPDYRNHLLDHYRISNGTSIA